MSGMSEIFANFALLELGDLPDWSLKWKTNSKT